jgi:hypothetical protein
LSPPRSNETRNINRVVEPKGSENMPGFSTEVSHTLGQAEAATRLKSFVEDVQERFKDQVSEVDGAWNDNVLDFSLTTFGLTVTGSLTVDESAARVSGQLPLAAMPFRGKIEQSIADELKQALS